MPADRVARRLLLIGAGCWVLAALVVGAVLAGMFEPADRAMLAAACAVDPASGAATLLRAATALGDWQVRIALAAAFFAYLAWRRFGRAASYILYTTLGIWALNAWVLKPLVARERPPGAGGLVGVADSFAMPSGHAANAAAVFTAMALVAGTIWWRRGPRRAIWAAAVLATLSVGVSRIGLGVHWASDVIAGWLVGAGFACLMAVLIRPVRARRPYRPEPPAI